jgi:carbamoyl-phosphate synthase small subunit
LCDHDVPALSGIDVRRLTLLLREKGVMRGALSTTDLDADRLRRMARAASDMSELSPWAEVTLPAPEAWEESVPEKWVQNAGLLPASGLNPRIVVLDCGVKRNIMRHLVRLGAHVTAVPWDASANEILSHGPDGVLISNGPADPRNMPEEVLDNVRALFGRVPVFGICLGHQILALASGARIYKLPFGHHGGNHPVQDLSTGRVEITAQNHNYAVEPDSLKGLPLQVTHTNLYDGTIEGLRHGDLPVSCVQYHPEASPGPHDSLYILRRFLGSLKSE